MIIDVKLIGHFSKSLKKNSVKGKKSVILMNFFFFSDFYSENAFFPTQNLFDLYQYLRKRLVLKQYLLWRIAFWIFEILTEKERAQTPIFPANDPCVQDLQYQ